MGNREAAPTAPIEQKTRDLEEAMNHSPGRILVTEIVITIAVVFGPMLLAAGEVVWHAA